MDLSTYGANLGAGKRTRASDEDYTPPPLPVAYQMQTERGAQPAPAAPPKATHSKPTTTGKGNAAGESAPAAPAPSHKAEPAPAATPAQATEVDAARVLEILRGARMLSATAIARRLGAEPQKVGVRLADLHRQGLAHRGPGGRWTAAPFKPDVTITRDQILAWCQGRARITGYAVAQALGCNKKTASNRLADLAAEGCLRRTGYGVYQSPDYRPPEGHDPKAQRKTEIVRAILRQAGRPISATEIYNAEPHLFVGHNAEQVCKILLDQLSRNRVSRMADGNGGWLWFDPQTCTPATRTQESAMSRSDDDDPILASIAAAQPPAVSVPPLADHAAQVRRLRGLAERSLLDPIITGWLRELANDIETQHRGVSTDE